MTGTTPWSTEVDEPTDTDAPVVRVSLLLTTDPGPMRVFRHFLDFDLDEAHATELLGKLTLALRDLRDRAAQNHHVRADGW